MSPPSAPAQLGLRRRFVERERISGGICLNWGCIPTKPSCASGRDPAFAEQLDYGLVLTAPSRRSAAVVKRSRGVSAQLAAASASSEEEQGCP